jgi:hypothetical protein
MDQFTEVLAFPVTVAVNCVLWDGARVELKGLMLTLTVLPPGTS